MGILAILSLVSPLLTTVMNVLASKGVVSSSVASLASSLTGASTSLIADLSAGKQTATSETLTVIQIVQQALAAVEADTSVDPTVVSEISESAAELKSFVSAYDAAQTTDDPSLLTPLAPIA